jgi:hypothetical protein
MSARSCRMTLTRGAFPIVELLLASVGTASAECAWVLWSHYMRIDRGFSRDLNREEMKDLDEIKERQRSRSFWRRSGRSRRWSIRALPATLRLTRFTSARGQRLGTELDPQLATVVGGARTNGRRWWAVAMPPRHHRPAPPEDQVTNDAGLWHPWLGIKRLLRDIVDGTAWEPTPWGAVQRAAWGAVTRTCRK